MSAKMRCKPIVLQHNPRAKLHHREDRRGAKFYEICVFAYHRHQVIGTGDTPVHAWRDAAWRILRKADA